jgi:hypothetical protein
MYVCLLTHCYDIVVFMQAQENDILDACAGVPLALELAGSLLQYNTNPAQWEVCLPLYKHSRVYYSIV